MEVGVCTILVCSMVGLVLDVIATARSGVVRVLREYAIAVARRFARV